MIKKLITKLLGKQVRNIIISEAEEHRILYEMYQIKGIIDYWQLQIQGGYQLFAKSRDEKYLGVVEMAETMLSMFNEMAKPKEEEEPVDDGYESTA